MFWPLTREHYTALSFASWSQLANGLMTLYKLSTLDEPAWDRAALRRDIDLLEVCDRIIRDMNDVGAARRRSEMSGVGMATATATTPEQQQQQQPPADTDLFAAGGRMIISMRNAWAAELAALEPDAADPAAAAAAAAAGLPPPDNGFVDNMTAGGLPLPVNFLDDAWLTDIFNVSSWE